MSFENGVKQEALEGEKKQRERECEQMECERWRAALDGKAPTLSTIFVAR